MNINSIQNLFTSNLATTKHTNTINNGQYNILKQDCFECKKISENNKLSFGRGYDYRATIDLKNAKTAEDARWTLARGANPNGTDGNGTPVLHYSIFNKTTGALKEIIHAGANIDATNKDGETALIFAAKHRNLDATLELIDAKANLDIKDKNGKTALDHAVTWAYEGYPFIQKALVSAGVDTSNYKIEFEPDKTGELQMVLTPKTPSATYELPD